MLYRSLVVFLFQVFNCHCYVLYNFDVKGNSLHGYYISSLIGTPPQRINLLIDTGSSNLAVAAINEKSLHTHYFLYNESLTFRPTNTEVRLRYVQGDWKGFLGLDILNPCLEKECSVICNISCMISTKDIFDNNSMFQGIMGLAYSSIAHPNKSVRPFLDVFFTEKNIAEVFAMLLCGPFFSSNESSAACGKLHIGYYSEDIIAGDIMYTPIVHEAFYEITVVDIKVDKNSVPVTCEELNKNKSIIDSGSTNLNVPLTVYPWVISAIKNYVKKSVSSNVWINETVVCTENKSLDLSLFPILTIALYHSNDKLYNLQISPELYMLRIFNNSCAMLAVGTSDYGTVIGSSILKGFYVIFDRHGKRIGFAKPKEFQSKKFISDISGLLSYSSDLNHCIRKEVSSFPAVLGLILICLIFITFCVLLPLLAWLWKYHIKKHKMDKSDIINLVDED